MAKLTSRNPYTGEVIEEFERTSDSELNAALDRATRRFQSDRGLPALSRSERLSALAKTIERHRETLAKTAVDEMGKTITAARAEVDKCAQTARWYADHLGDLLKDVPIMGGAVKQFLRPLPLGPILAVMPWNFPFWQAMRAAIPALGAGNVMLLKHASNVSRCALWMEKLFLEAGFPEGAFQTLLLESARVGSVIADPRLRGVTLTGSEAAGRSVAGEAGRHLKKVVLELGGSDPFIVMPSADLPKTATAAVAARTINNGQSCIAAKRFIVHEKIYDTFLESFAGEMRKVQVGDPTLNATQMGPLVHREGLATLRDQVQRAQEAQAKVFLKPDIDERHNLFSPAILQVPDRNDAKIFNEEFFGPVALVFRARTLDHAIEIANQATYGLGSSIWTRETAEAEHAIDKIEAGLTFVNKVVASEPQLPFGGVKNSGYGRELGRLGIHEFTNMKSVAIVPEP